MNYVLLDVQGTAHLIVGGADLQCSCGWTGATHEGGSWINRVAPLREHLTAEHAAKDLRSFFSFERGMAEIVYKVYGVE